MKFCKFFPLAMLSSVLSCSCCADYITRRVGPSDATTYTYYKNESESDFVDVALCSLVVKPYRATNFLVISDLYVIDNINCDVSFCNFPIQSFLLNVISNFTVNRDSNVTSFLIYTPESEEGLNSNSSFSLDPSFVFGKSIYSVLKYLDFMRFDCASNKNASYDFIDQNYARDGVVCWRLSKYKNEFENMEIKNHLEIKDI